MTPSPGRPVPDPGVCLEVDAGLYGGEETLRRAAHRFGGRCHVELRRATPDGEPARVEVRLRPRDGQPAPGDLKAEFLDELLDASLRLAVARESEAVRNLVLAHALSGLDLLDPEPEVVPVLPGCASASPPPPQPSRPHAP